MANRRGPASRQLSVRALGDVINRAKLAWRLFRDDRVSPALKVIPILGLIYLISPFDFLPDFFPPLGQLDDIAIILLALNWFIRACPSDVVEDIRNKGAVISARYTVIDTNDEHPGS